MRLGLGLGFSGPAGGGGSDEPATVVYARDDFAVESNTNLDGWEPDIGDPWVKTSGSTTAQIVGGAGYVTGPSSATYYVIPTEPPETDYEVRGVLTYAGGIPALLIGYPSNALDGYRLYLTSGNAMTFGRFDSGSSTELIASSGASPFQGEPQTIRFARFVRDDAVCLRAVNETTGVVLSYRDTHANRETRIGYGGISPRANARCGAPFAVRSTPEPIEGDEIVVDGARTWFNGPGALVDNGILYIGSVASNGDIQVSKTDGATVTTTVLNPELEVDDHDDAGLLRLPSGRLACFYSTHRSDDLGVRYRITTNALPDISEFTEEAYIEDGGLETTYAKPFLLSDGVVRLFFRSEDNSQKMATTDVADLEAGTETWSLNTAFSSVGSQRPYVVCSQHGNDRVDFLFTDGHPNETASSVYHAYLQIVEGSPKWYASDGTEITLPISPANATLIQGTDGGRCWNWGITLGQDGYPRVLYTRYPSSTGARNVMFKDIEYWWAKWDGEQWVNRRIKTKQVSLYPAENHYAGGLCFDGNDETTLYLAEQSKGVYEINEYSINEANGALTLITRHTRWSWGHNFRPVSPSGEDRPYRVTWLIGTYSTFTNFRLSICGAPVEPPEE